MCIPHGMVSSINTTVIKEERPKKSIKRVSQSEFEKGDPDFVDERTVPYEPKPKKSFLDELLGD